MKIKRFVYAEQDENNYLDLKNFPTLADAKAYARAQFKAAITKLLGDGYKVPPEHVDEAGYICHLTSKEEITSFEWGWTVFDGILDTIRACIEEVEIELTPAERRSAYEEVDHMNLLEDAKQELYSLADYDEDDGSSYDEASNKFCSEFGFTLNEATDPDSAHYVLETAVTLFEKYQNKEDTELGTWGRAVNDAVYATSKKAKPVIGAG